MNLIVRELGLQTYGDIWQQMKTFTQARTPQSRDELWLLEHEPVYTQGQAGKPEHILCSKDIPIIQSDRGGQITYHGPGQLICYVLMDIRRLNLGVRTLVSYLEDVLINILQYYNLNAEKRCNAPGVYIQGKKIASIGLRVRHGCTYHGIALNVDMDLSPFNGINPCGFAKMEMTQIKEFVPEVKMTDVHQKFKQCFFTRFEDYTKCP